MQANVESKIPVKWPLLARS